MHLFDLFNPWHATWMAVVVGAFLILSALAVLATMDPKQRLNYALVSLWLVFAGIVMISEGLALGAYCHSVSVALSYPVLLHEYKTGVWSGHGPAPVPITSLGDVGLVLSLMLTGAILLVQPRLRAERLPFAVGLALQAAAFTLAADIAMYHFGGHFLALVTDLAWLALGTALGNVVRVVKK